MLIWNTSSIKEVLLCFKFGHFPNMLREYSKVVFSIRLMYILLLSADRHRTSSSKSNLGLVSFFANSQNTHFSIYATFVSFLFDKNQDRGWWDFSCVRSCHQCCCWKEGEEIRIFAVWRKIFWQNVTAHV